MLHAEGFIPLQTSIYSDCSYNQYMQNYRIFLCPLTAKIENLNYSYLSYVKYDYQTKERTDRHVQIDSTLDADSEYIYYIAILPSTRVLKEKKTLRSGYGDTYQQFLEIRTSCRWVNIMQTPFVAVKYQLLGNKAVLCHCGEICKCLQNLGQLTNPTNTKTKIIHTD